jgi:hypothetical protein
MLSVCSRPRLARATATGANARGLATLLFALVLLASAPAGALDLEAAHGPHVRTESREMRELIDETSHRSPTFRNLVARLDRSDVIVYVKYRAFTGLSLTGRTGLLSVDGGHRFLIVEIACNQSKVVQMTTLSHELSHALEIADAPDIVNTASLARHYARIGIELTDGGPLRTFETAEAAEIGARVRREIVTSANGT